VTALLAGGFSMAHLYTTAADWALVVPKKGAKPAALTRSAPTSRAAPTDLSHDREKATQLPRGAPFLQALGLSGASVTDYYLQYYENGLLVDYKILRITCVLHCHDNVTRQRIDRYRVTNERSNLHDSDYILISPQFD
jgi:hypothetical protein